MVTGSDHKSNRFARIAGICWLSEPAHVRNSDCKTVATELLPFSRRDEADMEIRFISSLTAEDENAFAPALLKAVGALLDQLPIAYTMRIETTGAQVFQHTHAMTDEPKAEATEVVRRERLEAGVLRVDGRFQSSARKLRSAIRRSFDAPTAYKSPPSRRHQLCRRLFSVC